MPEGRLRQGGERHQGAPRRRASASTSTPRCSTASTRSGWPSFLDFVTSDLKVNGVSISPGYAYERAPDQEHFLNRQTAEDAVPGDLQARQGAQGQAQVAVRPVDAVPRLPRRQPAVPLHAVGQPDAQRLRLAAAVLSPERGLHPDLQGADGDDGLGELRHRRLREMRRLHGALRLRADGGERDRASIRSRR